MPITCFCDISFSESCLVEVGTNKKKINKNKNNNKLNQKKKKTKGVYLALKKRGTIEHTNFLSLTFFKRQKQILLSE